MAIDHSKSKLTDAMEVDLVKVISKLQRAFNKESNKNKPISVALEDAMRNLNKRELITLAFFQQQKLNELRSRNQYPELAKVNTEDSKIEVV